MPELDGALDHLIAAVRSLGPDIIWVRELSVLTPGRSSKVAVVLDLLQQSGTRVVTEHGDDVDLAQIETVLRRDEA